MLTCRKCKKPLDGSPVVTAATAATALGEGCFEFHFECWDRLTAPERAEANKIDSTLFGSDPHPRDIDWTLAIGQAFGLDSGLQAPLVPEAFANCLRLFLEHRSK